MIWLATVSAGWSTPPPELRGEVFVHDPSTVVACEGRFWAFGTGRGIRSMSSTDRVHWEQGPRVFEHAPAWTTERVPKNRGHLWAPDIIRHRGEYLLYYSVSSWGSRESAIGLAVNRTLDPASPAYGWEDRGVVVATTEQDDHNAIDPAVMRDEDGRLWMVYGSYWTGIKLVELDPDTGLRLAPDSPVHALAWKEAIEAACLLRKGGWYYLIVNWGQCCKGIDSTYELRVGRSRTLTGPYLDRDGTDLLQGGGSLLLSSAGPYIGPGHAGIHAHDTTLWMSYHYYSAHHEGRSRLDLLPMGWSEDGWPRITPRTPPEAQVEPSPKGSP